MSSEMRELIEDWRSGRLSGYVGLTKTERAVLRVCASELELRLARTEAGADAVREALAGQPIYLMGREHINEGRRPLAELVYGMTVPGTGVLFCMKDTEAAIPKDAEPVAGAGADGAVGYVSADGNAVWLTEGSFSLKPAAGTNLFAHPQDASGDAVYAGSLYITDRYVEFDLQRETHHLLELHKDLGQGQFEVFIRRNGKPWPPTAMQAKEAK